ncbi:hypothetical protein EBR96_02690 [bacterium]|nr:hypothetical protein [bacterium]
MKFRTVATPSGIDRDFVPVNVEDEVRKIAQSVAKELSPKLYQERIAALFGRLRFEDLPEAVSKTWALNRPGFDTVQIANFKIGDTTIQVKAYILGIDPGTGHQGAVIVPPHEHVEIGNKHAYRQAVTYLFAAEGDVRVSEGHFRKVGAASEGHVVLESLQPRALHSLGYDPSDGNIHNFEAYSQSRHLASLEAGADSDVSVDPTPRRETASFGKGLIIAVYVSNKKDPNKTYFHERVSSPERLAFLNGLIEDGYTPHVPDPHFKDPFIVDPELRARGDLDFSLLDRISEAGLVRRVQEQHYHVTDREEIPSQIASWGLGRDLETDSVNNSLAPLIRSVPLDGSWVISYKPVTISCEHSSYYRFNVAKGSVGIELTDELRSGIRVYTPKTGKPTLVIFLSPGHREASPYWARRAPVADLSRYGLGRLAINPFNLAAGLIESTPQVAEDFSKIELRIDGILNPERGESSGSPKYLSNNLGARNLSVTVPARSYISAVDLTFRELAGHFRTSGVEVEIRYEESTGDANDTFVSTSIREAHEQKKAAELAAAQSASSGAAASASVEKPVSAPKIRLSELRAQYSMVWAAHLRLQNAGDGSNSLLSDSQILAKYEIPNATEISGAELGRRYKNAEQCVKSFLNSAKSLDHEVPRDESAIERFKIMAIRFPIKDLPDTNKFSKVSVDAFDAVTSALVPEGGTGIGGGIDGSPIQLFKDGRPVFSVFSSHKFQEGGC